MMKKCTKCGKTKPRGEFYRDARARDGLRPYCKTCVKAYDKTYNKTRKPSIPAPPDDELATTFKTCGTCGESLPLTDFNKNKRQSYGRRHQCRSCHRAAALKWAKDFPDRAAASASLRRARKQNCCPFWVKGKLRKEIELIYFDSQQMKDITGVAYHVDHIIPIGNQIENEALVCGLHVPWNLQLLTATENLEKSDNFCLDPQT